MTRRMLGAVTLLVSLLIAAPIYAQQPPPPPPPSGAGAVRMPAAATATQTAAPAAKADARLVVTVVDSTGGVLPTAAVTLTGQDAATRNGGARTATSSDKGVVTFDGLVPGLYTLQSEFNGFDTALLKDVKIKSGENKHALVMTLKKLTDSVTVTEDKQQAATDRASLFGTALTREEIAALSDDPDEMQRQLQDLAGPDAVIRVDGFSGAPLPNKAQIKSIHITRDQFAAENHYAGGLFVDIITQPGVGPLAGSARMSYRNSALDGVNPLIGAKPPAVYQNYGIYLGGTLVRNKLDFSISGNGSDNFTTPTFFGSNPSGTGTSALVLGVRQPRRNMGGSGYVNYAVTRDQVIRLSFSRNVGTANNLGLNGQDAIERAYSQKSSSSYFMVQEAGPVGRRFFWNTRAYGYVSSNEAQSALEAPTIRVADSLTTGGAQVSGGTHATNVEVQSDLDYVRGIHSLRMGLDISGNWNHSNSNSNYLGTYTFTSLDAFNAGQPALFTRRIGNPDVRDTFVETGVYIQDDIRVSKSLTLSPGVRYEFQNHLSDWNNFGPRFGITWSPFKSGKTSIRASAGIFYDWLSQGTYEQTLRVDGFRQQELDIVDPGFPDPGSAGIVTPTNRYLLGSDIQMVRNTRFSLGFSQTLSPRISVNANYAHMRTANILSGVNVNAPVDGVRPDLTFSNVIETVSDARSVSDSLNVGLNIRLAAATPALQKAFFNWRRGSVNFFYTLAKADSNAIGTFTPSPTGTLDTEWGPSGGDVRHRFSASINSSAIRNFNAGFSLSAYTGTPYTITTGLDNNGDFIFNDRPDGVGRNTLRTTAQWNLSGNFSYSFGFGHKVTSTGIQGIMIMNGVASVSTGSSDNPRYRVFISLNAYNITNHHNLTGFSGVMTSPLFGQATAASGARQVNLNVSFSF